MITTLGAFMGFLLLSSGAMPKVGALAVPVASNYPVTLTAYNAVPEQTDSNPFETASGAYSNPEVVAARSQDLADELPFGTIIEIDGPNAPQNNCGYGIVAPIVGYRVIADTMNVHFTNRIDILFSTQSNYIMNNGVTKNAGIVLGVCSGASVRVVGHININRIPKTQDELATLVHGTSKALALK